VFDNLVKKQKNLVFSGKSGESILYNLLDQKDKQ